MPGTINITLPPRTSAGNSEFASIMGRRVLCLRIERALQHTEHVGHNDPILTPQARVAIAKLLPGLLPADRGFLDHAEGIPVSDTFALALVLEKFGGVPNATTAEAFRKALPTPNRVASSQSI